MLIGFDTETILKNRIHELYSAQFYNEDEGIEIFERERNGILKAFNCLEDGSTLIAHNAEFDCAVLKHAFCDEISIEALYNKSRFISAELKIKNNNNDNNDNKKFPSGGTKTYKVLDSMNYFPMMSLKKVGKIMGFKKLHKPSYLGLRKPKAGQELRYFKRYAMRDAEVCYKVGKFLESNYGKLKATLPAISFMLLRTNFYRHGLFMDYGSALEAKMREAYHGGRVDCFLRGTPERKVYRYDKRSLYPMVMHDNFFPDCSEGLIKSDDVDLDKYGIVHAKVRTDDEIGFLGVRRMCKDGLERLLFPQGIFWGWFTNAELKFFQDNSLGKILEVDEAHQTSGAQKYFRSFVDTFFKLRSDVPKLSEFYKLFMNAPYGKFAQDCSLTKVEFRERFCGKRRELKLKPSPRNFLIAAHITAYARIYMNEIYRKIGYEKLFYTDTDSIHASKKITHKSFINSTLKGFKLEDETDRTGRATYVRSKFYVFNDSLVCRGFYRIVNAPTMRSLLENGKVEQVADIIVRPRSAMKRHLTLGEVKEMPRLFSASADEKRAYDHVIETPSLLSDFSFSEPLILKE